ncbi:MAG: hypothetical protein HOV79_09825 [Hamadaea sp.]|nr:hypothetical protein [Hamadaea sp.]
MVAWIGSLQPLLIAAVLLWSARAKLFSRYAEAHARRSALAPLLGENRALPAYRLLGGVEAALAAALLVPGLLLAEAVAAAALSTGFLAYLAYARIKAPDSTCGCMGAQSAPVNGRSFGRAGVLLAAALTALAADGSWLAGLADRPVLGLALLVAEGAAVVAFSPELDRHWLLPLRRLHARITHPLASPGSFDVPLDSTVEQLQRSSAYRELAPSLRSDVREHWDEPGWRILVYSARYAGREGSAVFAVPRLTYAPETVRAAIVDATGATLLSLESHPTPEYAL